MRGKRHFSGRPALYSNQFAQLRTCQERIQYVFERPEILDEAIKELDAQKPALKSFSDSQIHYSIGISHLKKCSYQDALACFNSVSCHLLYVSPTSEIYKFTIIRPFSLFRGFILKK